MNTAAANCITSDLPVIRPQSGKVELERSDFQQKDFRGLGAPHGRLVMWNLALIEV